MEANTFFWHKNKSSFHPLIWQTKTKCTLIRGYSDDEKLSDLQIAKDDNYDVLAFDDNENGGEGEVEDMKEEDVVYCCHVAVDKVADHIVGLKY